MTPLEDVAKKRLTEFLGECWHEFGYSGGGTAHYCLKKCGTNIDYGKQRTFSPDDWQSLGDLKKKLVEKGKWIAFCWFAHESDEWADYFDNIPTPKHENYYLIFYEWLINPGVFIPMVDEFLKEGGLFRPSDDLLPRSTTAEWATDASDIYF